MPAAAIPSNESERLESLYQYQILDTAAEKCFDDLVHLAAHTGNTPIAVVSLVDGKRQWFKAEVGIGAKETCRSDSFCAHAILQPNELLIINDTLKDERFATNQLVTSEPHIRFYAGAPLVAPDGSALGTICVMDTVPGELSTQQQEGLRVLANQVVSQLELRRHVTKLNLELEQNLTKLQSAEGQLTRHAFYDNLTNLPNRALLMNRLEKEIEWAKQDGNSSFAVLFIDLDRFKVVNDSLGHLIGDQLLVGVARRLENCLRPNQTLARLRGDGFTILLPEIKDMSDATNLAEQIQKQLALPFYLSGKEVFTSVSMGIALSGAGCELPEDLLRNAHIAMYRAKVQGKACYEVFSAAMYDRAVALLQLEMDLRRAIEYEEFCLHYQPIVSLTTGSIIGFEALIRWQHPERGLVSPAEFIPLAEETGMIIPMGDWVLYEACHQLYAWQKKFPSTLPLTVSVNLSGKQFAQPNLIEQIQQVLQKTGLDARNLKLEITESAIVENPEYAANTLRQLRQLGVQLHMDDFGTGYSSLSYLQRFPIDTLKIDRSFVSNMAANQEDGEIVRTITNLAQNLGMAGVAEGVETLEQAARLRELGCEYGQGDFFSKPLNAQAVEALLENKPLFQTHRDSSNWLGQLNYFLRHPILLYHSLKNTSLSKEGGA